MRRKSNASIVKIGKSYDVDSRKKQIERLVGEDLELVSVIDYDVESSLHDKFYSLNVEGEWFFDDGSISALFADSEAVDRLIFNAKKAFSDSAGQIAGDPSVYMDAETGMFNLTKIVSDYNLQGRVFNLSQWLKQKRVQAIVEYNKSAGVLCLIIGRGRGSKTLGSSEIYVELMLSMQPERKIDILSGVIGLSEFFPSISYDSKHFEEAKKAIIKNSSKGKAAFEEVNFMERSTLKACMVDSWENANEHQRNTRQKIYQEVALLADVLGDVREAVNVAVNRNKIEQ